jgi:hypothetical protein
VATQRKDRIKDRRALETESGLRTEAEAELEKCRTEVQSTTAQLQRLSATAERSRSDSIAKRAAEKALDNLGTVRLGRFP